jgi:hypothetical protein
VNRLPACAAGGANCPGTSHGVAGWICGDVTDGVTVHGGHGAKAPGVRAAGASNCSGAVSGGTGCGGGAYPLAFQWFVICAPVSATG